MIRSRIITAGARRARQVLPAISLAMFALCCIVWTRAQFTGDLLGWAGWTDRSAGTWHGWGLNIDRSKFTFHYFTGEWVIEHPQAVSVLPAHQRTPHWFHTLFPPMSAYPSDSWWRSLGFDMLAVNQPPGTKPFKLHLVAVPFWFLAIAFAAWPAHWVIDHLRNAKWRRIEVGLCVTCGYDLTGNVSGTCPECGTAISSSQSRSRIARS